MPLEGIASQRRGSSENAKKRKLNIYAAGILILSFIAIILYPFKKAPVQVNCPSSFTQDLIQQFNDPDLNCDAIVQTRKADRTDQEKQKYSECVQFTRCIPCPKFGHCDQSGNLTCSDGYIKENFDCVEN